ncbi:MAG: GGDEF domain-containing protein [Acidobacteria bacterium]|nr:GGDEF domain-containing protein [Acidobacteriota bacterium]
MRPALTERLQRCTGLPSLPAVAIRVLELCEGPDLDLMAISSAISRDPAMAARLIKVVNSPLLAVRKEITSIPNALSLLGINAVRTMVLTFSLSDFGQKAQQTGLQSLWRRSVLSGLAARSFSTEIGFKLADEALLCGLLQDMGMLALATAFGDEYGALQKESSNDHDRLCELEHRAFGADHAAVGGWLLRRWGMPPILADVVEASHDPLALGDDGSGEAAPLARIVALSGRFADRWEKDLTASSELLERDLGRYWPQLALNTGLFMTRLVETAREATPLFDVRLDSEDHDRVREQAQEALLRLGLRTSQEIANLQESVARLESRTATLLADSQRDPLTGVANRACTDAYLENVFRVSAAGQLVIGVIFVDVDHFKAINDTFGHVAGDAVLQTISSALRYAVRSSDFVGRFGGDEFIAIARITESADLHLVAERLRQAVANDPHITRDGRTVPATISLGCVVIDPRRHHSVADVLEEADQALYKAKHTGRNRLFFGPAIAH